MRGAGRSWAGAALSNVSNHGDPAVTMFMLRPGPNRGSQLQSADPCSLYRCHVLSSHFSGALLHVYGVYNASLQSDTSFTATTLDGFACEDSVSVLIVRFTHAAHPQIECVMWTGFIDT